MTLRLLCYLLYLDTRTARFVIEVAAYAMFSGAFVVSLANSKDLTFTNGIAATILFQGPAAVYWFGWD